MSNARNISKLASLAAHITNLIGLSASKAAIDAKVAAGDAVTSVNGATGAVTVSGGYSNMVVLTASGTWTVPAGITKAKVTVIGGGGGQSGQTVSLQYAPAGGVGGGVLKYVTGLTPGANIAVTVGAAGAAGATNGGNATAGGSSTFAAPGGTLTAGGGGFVAANSARITGGTGGTATGGDLNIPGISPAFPSSYDRAIPHPFGHTVYGRSSIGMQQAAVGPGTTGGPGAIIIEY